MMLNKKDHQKNSDNRIQAILDSERRNSSQSKSSSYHERMSAMKGKLNARENSIFKAYDEAEDQEVTTSLN